MLVIPRTPEEITADWLGQVLEAPVHRVRIADSHAGTTGRAVLELDYAVATRLPRRLFAKLPPADEMQRDFVRATGMGRREALFYRQLSGEVPLRVPRCYHADCDDTGDNYIMLLEHLEDSGCTFRNASEHYSLAAVRQVLNAFAALHAAYWDSPRFDTNLRWVEPPIQHEITGPLIEQALGQYGEQMPPVFTAMGELYLAHADRIHALWREGTATLIHGDVHDANLFLDGQTPGFLDWALVARGPGMRDVGYYLAGTLSEQDQQQHNRALLEHYRRELLAREADAPPLEVLWRQYQWHAAYVWVGATVTLAMGDAWQPLNYVLRSLQQLHPALDCLDTVNALRDAL